MYQPTAGLLSYNFLGSSSYLLPLSGDLRHINLVIGPVSCWRVDKGQPLVCCSIVRWSVNIPIICLTATKSQGMRMISATELINVDGPKKTGQPAGRSTKWDSIQPHPSSSQPCSCSLSPPLCLAVPAPQPAVIVARSRSILPNPSIGCADQSSKPYRPTPLPTPVDRSVPTHPIIRPNRSPVDRPLYRDVMVLMIANLTLWSFFVGQCCTSVGVLSKRTGNATLGPSASIEVGAGEVICLFPPFLRHDCEEGSWGFLPPSNKL